MVRASALALVVLAWPVMAEEYPPGLFPPGFLIFCEEHPAECMPVEPAAPLRMSDWRETLERINREVNATITYRLDPNSVSGQPGDLYTRVGLGDVPDGDRWTIGPSEGDCDDYTVTKRHRLIEAGVPRGVLRMAYVLPVNMGPHLFLVVSTDEGDLVLDSTSDEIGVLDRYMLEHLSIQDAIDPRQWWQIY